MPIRRASIAAIICFGGSTVAAAAEARPPAVLQRDAHVVSVAAIYFSPVPRGDPERVAAQLLRSKYGFFAARSDRKPTGDGATVHVEYVDLEKARFEPPGIEQLRYFGHGVSSERAQALQTSTRGLILSFSYRGPQAFEALRQIAGFLSELASRTDGLIWDEDTRELYGVEAWDRKRRSGWIDGVPMAQNFICIHAYKNTDFVRAISLGMSKFGLPDLVIDDFSWSLNRQMGNTINAVAQALIEGTPVPDGGPFDLRVAAIRHETVREQLTKSFIDDATGVGTLVVKTARRDEGDPDNRLVELAFDRYSGATVQERQDQYVDRMFGHKDGSIAVRHDAAVLAASKRAQARFETYRKRFEAGLAPGEHIMVKAPFRTTTGGNEWMWVEVVQWTGGDIRGLLRNDPDFVPGLHAGATVHVKQAEIFDYIRYTADGKEEGNETGPLLEQSAR